MIVVDNSVLAGFTISADDYHAAAVEARDVDSDWHAPELIRSEFRSVATGHLRRGSGRDVIDEASHLADQAVTLHRLDHGAVFDVLEKAKLSAYDAEYVALARELGCKLVTTDKQVLDAFPELAVRLADFRTPA